MCPFSQMFFRRPYEDVYYILGTLKNVLKVVYFERENVGMRVCL